MKLLKLLKQILCFRSCDLIVTFFLTLGQVWMSMILDYFYKYLLKITKTQNLFQKIYMPIQFNNFWWTERSIFFWLLKTVLAPWAKSSRRGGPTELRHNKKHYILFNFLFFSLNFLLGRAKIYLVFQITRGAKIPP